MRHSHVGQVECDFRAQHSNNNTQVRSSATHLIETGTDLVGNWQAKLREEIPGRITGQIFEECVSLLACDPLTIRSQSNADPELCTGNPHHNCYVVNQ